MAATTELLKRMQAEQKEAKRNIELLDISLQESRSQLLGQVDAGRLMQIEAQDMNEKLVNDHYCNASHCGLLFKAANRSQCFQMLIFPQSLLGGNLFCRTLDWLVS